MEKLQEFVSALEERIEACEKRLTEAGHGCGPKYDRVMAREGKARKATEKDNDK